jgi:N-acetylglutamate synthase-like GNAT family acetyltransferase
VTGAATLRAADCELRRATIDDLDRVVALQRAAYAPNRAVLGVEPIPLMADYNAILFDMEVWLAEEAGNLRGVLILEPRADDLLLWSIAVSPAGQGTGLGRALLAATEERARQLGRAVVRLYTGTVLTDRVAWYARHGYAVERIEVLSDRSVTHMMKQPVGRGDDRE